MINQAILIIKHLLPKHVEEELINVEENSEYFTATDFSISKIKNIPNFLMINNKRLSENIEDNIRVNLQKNIDFINKSDPLNSIWHGYIVENRIRKYFIIDVNREQFLLYEEPLES